MKAVLLLVMLFGCLELSAQNGGNSNTQYNNSTNSNELKKEEPVLLEEKTSAPASSSKKKTKTNYNRTTTPSAKKAGVDDEKSSDKDVESLMKQQSVQQQNFTSSYKLSNQQSTRRSPTAAQQHQMEEVVNYYEKNDPNSFEYHYYKYVSGNYNTAWYEHLEKAKALRPNNLDVTEQMAAYHFIMNQREALKTDLGLLLQGGKLESDLLNFGKHLLQSVPQQGILITHGFADTYSAMYAQQVMSVRTDVRILSLDFLQSEQYRKTLEAEGLKIAYTGAVDVALLTRICQDNANKALQLCMTIPKPYLQPLVSNLSIMGLTFRYDPQHTDLFAANEAFWNELKTSKEMYAYTDENSKKLSSNYLPLLMYLKTSYQEKGMHEKEKEVDAAIDRVSVQCKMKDKVKGYGY